MQAMEELSRLPNRPLWQAPAKQRAALEGAVEADVAIVGAGYTGLWTAYYLLKDDPALRVVLLDREHVGFGASGRNGGWASAIFPISLEKVASFASRGAALDLQAAMNETVDEIGRVTAAEGIDADYAKEGFLSLARSAAQAERAQSAVRSSVAFGLPDQVRYIGADEAVTRVGATDVRGGVYTPHCATIHPGKLVRGLAETVESLGARIYHGTPVTDIAPGAVTTPNGSVRARTVIRATEAYSSQQPGARRAVIPLYSLVLATEPLDAGLRASLNLDHRMAFNDMRHLRVYAQVTEEGRLVFGGRGAPYHFNSRIAPGFDTKDSVHHKVFQTLTEFFPQLADVRVTHRWGGALGVARDWCPSIGYDPETGMGWAGNYVGDGVATSNLAGRILRNLIFRRDDALERLPIVNHRSPSWEREPFRWFGVNLGLAAAAAGDAEERFTDRPSKVAGLLEKMTGAH